MSRLDQHFSHRTVVVATRAELKNEHYYRRLWLAARNISLSRRRWLDELAACVYDFRGSIIHPSGDPYIIPDIDTLFGNDPDMRWLSYFLGTDTSGFSPRAMSRKFERVQFIDLYFKIKHPNIAAHFGK